MPELQTFWIIVVLGVIVLILFDLFTADEED